MWAVTTGIIHLKWYTGIKPQKGIFLHIAKSLMTGYDIISQGERKPVSNNLDLLTFASIGDFSTLYDIISC